MADWNIRPRALQCSNCGKDFPPKSTGHTLLSTTEEGYVRKDLCDDCFKALDHSTKGLPSAAWSFTVPAENTKLSAKAAPVQKDTAIQLLRKLVVRDAAKDHEAIYVLAILLERSKQFIERDVQQTPEGKTIRLYEFRTTGELFSIKAPNIRPDDLPFVQQRVIDLLEGREKILQEAAPPPRAKPKRICQCLLRKTFRIKRYYRKLYNE